LYKDIFTPDIFFSVINDFASSIFELPVRNKVNAASVNPNNVAITGMAFCIISYNNSVLWIYYSTPLAMPITSGPPHSYNAIRFVNVEK
jgi:hypothetical protein